MTKRMNTIQRIEELIEEYARDPYNMDLRRTVVEIKELVLKGRECPYKKDIFCRGNECWDCPIWKEDSHNCEPAWHHTRSVLGAKI